MIRKIFGIFILSLSILLFFAYFSLNFRNPLKKSFDFEIKKGDNPKGILKILKEKGIIFDWQFPYIYLKFTKLDKKIKAGEYQIQPGERVMDILKKFLEGRTIYIPVTLKEGWTIFDYAKELERKGICSKDSFLNSCKRVPLWIEAKNMEGFLYPDTYFFRKNTPSDEVVIKLYNNFLKKTKDLRQVLQEKKLKPLEWITLASIVEREAKMESEKPKIAGVYLNRLKINMKLEADPTILYGMALAGIERKILTKEDLKFPSDYNTYLNYGLPPGPICNPSYSSMKAVLYPEEHNFLFFVAKGDGSHIFSENLKDHIKAIQLYR
ncbi:MAG: endolytic transglycosylase MltG [Thermoanaerobaculia bacterium]